MKIFNQQVYKGILVGSLASASLFCLAWVGWNSSSSGYMAQAETHFNGSQGYDVAQAASLYQKAWKEEGDTEALFHLARLALVDGSPEQAVEYADQYLALDPRDTRAEYVKGLAYGYLGKYADSREAFVAHILSGNSGWAGYLDLAWTEFKAGNYALAQTALEQAKELEDNAWVNASLGAVLHAQGQKERAIEVLEKAQSQAASLSIDEWVTAYSANNDKEAEHSIQGFRELVEVNLALARGDEASITSVEFSRVVDNIAGISPAGFNAGLVVSACAETCTSAPNSCGAVNRGTRSCTSPGSCTSCNAGRPANPSYYNTSCTVANACGDVAHGRRNCSNSCAVAAPPLPSKYGQPCLTPNSCGLVNSGLVGCANTCLAVAPIESYCSMVSDCSDPNAINYREEAPAGSTASCLYEGLDISLVGCSDPAATNYDPASTVSLTCTYLFEECTDASAINHNNTAAAGNGACYYRAAQQCEDQNAISSAQGCVSATTLVPQLECSLDQDWSDDDNSCEQEFLLQSVRVPIYVRATSNQGACSVRNTTWSVVGGRGTIGNNTGNTGPTISAHNPNIAETKLTLSGTPQEKIFQRDIIVAMNANCTTAPAIETINIKLVDIDTTEE